MVGFAAGGQTDTISVHLSRDASLLQTREFVLTFMKRWRLTIVIVLVSIVVRAPFAISALNRPGFNWRWGGEMFSIASAIVSGQGFSSPYWVETGPTAQQSPGFPYFLAALYYLGGGSMDFAIRALAGLNVAFSALTCLILIAIGDRLRPGHGNLFGLAWAVLPILGFTEVVFFWDTALYTLIFICLIWLLMKIVDVGTLSNFFWWGAMAGMTLMLDPAHILVLGLILTTLWMMSRISFTQFAISGGVTVLIIAPWIIRNNVEVGYPTFIRSNIGYEIYRGLATDPLDTKKTSESNPGRNPTQLALYKELGEHRYMAHQTLLAKDLFLNDPSFAMRRIAVRMIVFWGGSEEVDWREPWSGVLIHVRPLFRLVFNHALFAIPALTGLLGLLLLLNKSEDRVAAAIITIVILAFPIPYYLTLTMPRYRAPIEPFLVLLSGYGLLRVSSNCASTKCAPVAPTQRETSQ
jgi:hypothetical protein